MSKPRICIVASDIWPVLADSRSFTVIGGMEVQLSILARAFVQSGFHVLVVTKDFGQADGTVVDGITVYRSHKPNDGLPVLRFFHPRLTSWWRALKRADADIYLQRSADFLTGVTGLFSRLHGRRFIYSGAHDLDFKRDETWKLFRRRMGWRDQMLYDFGLKQAQGIVAQHERQVTDCAKWYGRTATRIPNCYACAPLTMPQAKDLVLWVATVKPMKRPELLLELARDLPQLRFRLVGGAGKDWESAAYDAIQETALSMGNVEFTGFVPYAEVGAQFDQARVFVNTSDFEGFPNTFLQAWARGIPTVSFFDCGARLNGRPVGFVCRDITEMRDVVSRLCEDDQLWEAESRRAQDYFRSNHSVEEAVQRYDRLFQSVLSSKERC